jgi:anti-sigma regulatory factor (Ser/Thr protein kinase)
MIMATQRAREGPIDGELDVPRAVLTVYLPARWSNVRPVVEFVSFTVASRLGAEPAARASMATHELLENAVKYGDLWRDIALEVVVEPSGTFEIRVVNRAVQSRISILQKEIRRLDTLGAEEGLVDAMKRAARLPQGCSMLGLARLRLEARVTLEFDIQGERVLVVARGAP